MCVQGNPGAEDRRHEVTRKTIEEALQPSELNESDTALTYVRECFDELYFKVGQLQDAIDNDLVELQHVSCPADYYVGVMATDVELHRSYLTRYDYPRALKFLENFDSWKTARRKAELKDPPEAGKKPERACVIKNTKQQTI